MLLRSIFKAYSKGNYFPGSSVHGDSPGKNTGVGCLALLQGIFPTQGSNPGFPPCRQILYHLSHQGSPRILEWVAIPSPADLPNLGIKSASPALQANSSPAELQGRPIIGSMIIQIQRLICCKQRSKAFELKFSIFYFNLCI